jgi:hypothetical protein
MDCDRVAVSTAMPHRHGGWRCQILLGKNQGKIRECRRIIIIFLVIFNTTTSDSPFIFVVVSYKTDRRYQSSPPIWMPFRRLPTRPPMPKVFKMITKDNRMIVIKLVTPVGKLSLPFVLFGKTTGKKEIFSLIEMRFFPNLNFGR